MSETPVLIEPVGVIMDILKHHADKGRRKPKMFPTMLREAAQFWIAHQEPPDDRKEAVREVRSNGTLIGFETPYHDRLARNLKTFLRLSDLYQSLIIDAAERQIYWRGDRMGFFAKVIKQADEMAKDPEAYKEKYGLVLQNMGIPV